MLKSTLLEVKRWVNFYSFNQYSPNSDNLQSIVVPSSKHRDYKIEKDTV